MPPGRAEAAGRDPVLERLAGLDRIDQLGQPGKERPHLRQVTEADQGRADPAREVLGQEQGPAVDTAHRTLRAGAPPADVSTPSASRIAARAAEVQGAGTAIEHEPVSLIGSGLSAGRVGVEHRDTGAGLLRRHGRGGEAGEPGPDHHDVGLEGVIVEVSRAHGVDVRSDGEVGRRPLTSGLPGS